MTLERALDTASGMSFPESPRDPAVSTAARLATQAIMDPSIHEPFVLTLQLTSRQGLDARVPSLRASMVEHPRASKRTSLRFSQAVSWFFQVIDPRRREPELPHRCPPRCR